MTRALAQRLVDSYAQKLEGFENRALYVGVLEGEHVFYIERLHHGGHLGLPPYFSITNSGLVYQLLPPKIFKASKMRHRLSNN